MKRRERCKLVSHGFGQVPGITAFDTQVGGTVTWEQLASFGKLSQPVLISPGPALTHRSGASGPCSPRLRASRPDRSGMGHGGAGREVGSAVKMSNCLGKTWDKRTLVVSMKAVLPRSPELPLGQAWEWGRPSKPGSPGK